MGSGRGGRPRGFGPGGSGRGGPGRGASLTGGLAGELTDGGSRDTGLIVLGRVADGDAGRLAGAEKITIEAAP
ncbi:hypothetical protein [Streptomyces sp. NPDC002328]|uniref:hypothetical protein n=1 Tax=Streptomyces sp. NPDC002328 TaxID=3364642 RepID=UPI0036ADE4AB